MTKADARSSDPAGEIDVYVVADGTTVPVDATQETPGTEESRSIPAALVDLALGLLAEPADDAVDFVWTGDESAPYWEVRLERVVLGRRTAVRLHASRRKRLRYALTKRELDVVTLLIAGLSNAAIAAALRLSPRTVTTHVDHIMRKVAAPSRSAVATLALDAGIVGVPLPVDAPEFRTLRVGRVVGSAGTRRAPTPAERRALLGPATPILIGSLVPLHGRARDDGLEMIQGAALAIEEINARGGVHGHPLRLQVHDVDVDRDGFANVTEAVHDLLGTGVHAITSGYLLHQERAVDLAAADGVPLLHVSAASYIDDLVAGDPDRYRGTFQVCPSDRNYAANYVAFMTDLRDSGRWVPSSRTLVVAQQNMWDIVDFGLDAATPSARAQGWDLVAVDVPDREDSAAWAALPRRIAGPAAVMLGSFFIEDHLRFLHSFLTDPSPSLIYSIYAPSVPAFRRRAPRHGDGLLWASTTGTYSDEIAREFAQAYKARFGALPGRSMAGAAYDRVHILAQVWGQATDPGDYDAVGAGLLRVRYRGVNGAYSFSGAGHGTLPLGIGSNDPSIAQAHTIFQIQGRKNVLLAPRPYATGEFVAPAWTTG